MPEFIFTAPRLHFLSAVFCSGHNALWFYFLELCVCVQGAWNKLYPFSPDIKSAINKPHLQTCHILIDCPIKKLKKDLSILWPADALTALSCLLSKSIHLIHYNIIDFYVSQREWSIILYLGDIKRDYKGKSGADWTWDMEGSVQTSLMNGWS